MAIKIESYPDYNRSSQVFNVGMSISNEEFYIMRSEINTKIINTIAAKLADQIYTKNRLVFDSFVETIKPHDIIEVCKDKIAEKMLAELEKQVGNRVARIQEKINKELEHDATTLQIEKQYNKLRGI